MGLRRIGSEFLADLWREARRLHLEREASAE